MKQVEQSGAPRWGEASPRLTGLWQEIEDRVVCI
jgi:hypothetical protein